MICYIGWVYCLGQYLIKFSKSQIKPHVTHKNGGSWMSGDAIETKNKRNNNKINVSWKSLLANIYEKET